MLTSLASHADKLKFVLNENSPAILSGIGIVGTVATAYVTGRATFKAARLIETENFNELAKRVQDDSNVRDDGFDLSAEALSADHLSTKEKAQLVWKEYIPAAGVGVLTVTSIFMAHRISAKRIAALIVASGISERALQEYKDKIVEKFGPNKDRDIRDGIAQDRVTNNPPNDSEVLMIDEGKVLCFDTMTGRYFKSSIEDIKRAENACNFDINQQMSVSFSRFSDEIGLQPTDYTDNVGWNINNLIEVQFSTTLGPNNLPCIAMGFARPPVYEYENSWET